MPVINCTLIVSSIKKGRPRKEGVAVVRLRQRMEKPGSRSIIKIRTVGSKSGSAGRVERGRITPRKDQPRDPGSRPPASTRSTGSSTRRFDGQDPRKKSQMEATGIRP